MEMSIAIVNSNTPKIARNLLKSIHENMELDNIHEILIINNGCRAENGNRFNDINKVREIYLKKNIGHGPGMDVAIKNTTTDYLIILDSDTVVYEKGLFGLLRKEIEKSEAVALGVLTHVNINGYDVPFGSGIQYLHPSCLLIKKAEYLKLPAFINHGAPCIKFFAYIKNRGIKIRPVIYNGVSKNYCSPIYEKVFHVGRGSRSKGYKEKILGKIKGWNFGYNVDHEKIRHWLNGL